VVLSVHEFEEKEYRNFHDNECMILPDALRGNMAKVRSFILEHSDCEVCVMMDDDVQYLACFENGKVQTLNQKGGGTPNPRCHPIG